MGRREEGKEEEKKENDQETEKDRKSGGVERKGRKMKQKKG